MSAEPQIPGAWIELPAGLQRPLTGSCAIGRSATNTIVLEEPKVSRRHAIVHLQGNHEHWLVDLGSRNGTYLNGRRVIQPTRLQDQDRINIGDNILKFRQSAQPHSTTTAVTDATVLEIRSAPRWLLLADVVGYTQMTRKLPPNELSMLIGQWLDACREIIDRNHGAINKFLGDGFLAYWPNEAEPAAISRTLAELRDRQETGEPIFRIVVHHGEIVMGGASLGEESLMGASVNKVFRMEKLAGSIGESRLMSAEAFALLSPLVAARRIEDYQLAGFEGKETFYSFLAAEFPTEK